MDIEEVDWRLILNSAINGIFQDKESMEEFVKGLRSLADYMDDLKATGFFG